MKLNSKKLLAGLVGALCLFAFVISPVSAGMGMGAGNDSAADCVGDCDQIRDRTCDETCDQTCERTCNRTCDQTCDQLMENRLAMLEGQGIDVTEIRAALELGNMDEAHSLMAEFRGECTTECAGNCYVKGNGHGIGSGYKFQGQASIE